MKQRLRRQIFPSDGLLKRTQLVLLVCLALAVPRLGHASGPDDSLLETELLDSIAIMQIVAFCEQVFDINIPEEELLPDHFETIREISQLVERRLADKPA